MPRNVTQEVNSIKVKKLDLDLIPQLKAKDIRAKRHVLSKTLEGSWTTLLKGRGMEFAGFRQYTYGDDASRIDWGASLRSKETLIREFEEYKSVNVLFVIDVSDTMLFTSQKKLKAEYAVELAFNLGVSILENGDAVGYALVTDRVRAYSVPAIGKRVVYDMANAFSTPSHYGGKKDLVAALNLVNALLKQRSLIILISDFLGMNAGWERYVRMTAQRADLIGIMLRDPRDKEFPDFGGQFLLQDPETGEKLHVDVKQYRQRYAQNAAQEEQYVRNIFDASHAGFVSLTTGEDLLQPIAHYFRKRSAIIRG